MIVLNQRRVVETTQKWRTHTFSLTPSFAIIVQSATLQFFAMMHHLFEVFRLQMMERLEHVLFDIIVERVFDVGHLSQRFAHFDKTIGCVCLSGCYRMRVSIIFFDDICWVIKAYRKYCSPPASCRTSACSRPVDPRAVDTCCSSPDRIALKCL